MICEYCGVSPEQHPAAPLSHTDRIIPPPVPGISCCPRCYGRDITFQERGFSLLWGLLGFFFLPPFGLLFGLIGAKKLRYRCQTCSHKWKRQ